MFTRPHLRHLVAGTVAVFGLVGIVAASHAQVAFWHRAPVDNPALRVGRVSGGWDMASVRSENRDHVQAQIDRMEKRARNDDRLSGRPATPGRDEQGTGRQSGNPDRNTSGDPSIRGTDVRPANAGPGWQARGRDGGR